MILFEIHYQCPVAVLLYYTYLHIHGAEAEFAPPPKMLPPK